MDFINSKSRLFVISEFVDKARNSTGYYWNKTIRGISDVKADTFVISTKSSCELARSNSGSETYVQIDEGQSYKKNSLFGRLLGQLTLSLHFFLAIAKNVKRGDIIFSGTNPAFLLIFIFLLKPVIRFKWVLLVHDVFPENLISAKVIHRKSVAYKLAKILFDFVYAKADCLIAIGRDMQELVATKTKNKVEVIYIPNWVDCKDVAAMPRKVDSLLPSQDLSDKIVFQFFGNLGRVQGLDNLLEAIALVKSIKAKFVFIGGGAGESLVHKFIVEHPECDVEAVPSLPFEKNNDGLAACDIAIVSLAPGMKGLGVPSKAYFSLAADKPILVVADDGSELQLMLAEHPDVGWFCPAGKPQELAKLIDRVCELDISAYSLRPRHLVCNKYEYQTAIGQYLAVLDAVVNR